jgi:4-hydroxybenzoate polyprenyltransferase
MKALGGLAETAEMIKLQHTVFALPFAVISLVTSTGSRWPSPRTWLWVVVAMVTARTAAMCFNRLVDHGLDAINPRTASRSLPAGRLGRGLVWTITVFASALFVVAAAALNPLCLALAGPTIVVLLGYSYAKRFTSLAHVWLGLALGISPVGAWIAGAGRIDTAPVVLATAVLLWVAGFDVIYALQDEDFDRRAGLHSLPVRLGAAGALTVARVMHLGAFLAFAVFAVLAGGGALRLLATAAAGGLLLWQHHLVRPGVLERVDAAFFTANGLLSLLMGALYLSAKMTWF